MPAGANPKPKLRKARKMATGTKNVAHAAFHFFANAFSAICLGRSNPVFSRHTSPIFIKSRNVSCSLKSSFCAQPFTLSSVVSAILIGMVLLNFSFINFKVHTKFILDNPKNVYKSYAA